MSDSELKRQTDRQTDWELFEKKKKNVGKFQITKRKK